MGENLRKFFFPVYSVYRCHNCNWRGWLPRSGFSPLAGKILLVIYAVAVVGLILFIINSVVGLMPRQSFQY